MNRFLFLLLCLSPLLSCAQNDSRVYIAPYKNDAAGAYTLIHDDFGGSYANGIELYADTMAFNRGIPFCFAIITKECDEQDWNTARALMKHGHQPVNHSHSHLCGKPQSWCTFGDWDEKDFPVEIDQSTALIQQNTGVHPAFFMYPFDLYTDTMITYLIAQGYAGTRAGTPGQIQHSSSLNPFRHNYVGIRPEQAFNTGNDFVDQAILQKGWAIRVTHGVADQSWGAPPAQDYREHLDYLKQKSDSNLLWVATMSDVLWYITWQRQYEVKMIFPSVHTQEIIFTKVTTNQIYNPDEKANEKTLRTTSSVRTLTVVIPQFSRNKKFNITQKGKAVNYSYSGDKLLIQANPEDGNIRLEYLR